MEEELSMKLLLQMSCSERQTPALPSQNQICEVPSQQVQRGLTGAQNSILSTSSHSVMPLLRRLRSGNLKT